MRNVLNMKNKRGTAKGYCTIRIAKFILSLPKSQRAITLKKIYNLKNKTNENKI